MRRRTLEPSEWEQLAKEAKFDVNKMALLLSVSERQLQRLFKKQFADTPSRWLQGLRCRLARELLSQGYSTKAAAAEMGFASGSHMCHHFKRLFGSSPQSFAPIPEALLK
jgi:transcriptional regulator GlxA family with amidase domain